MLLVIVAFAVCLISASVLFVATGYIRRLRVSIILTLTVLSMVSYVVVLYLRPFGLFLSNVMVLTVALFLGSSLGCIITSKPVLASFCIAAAITDIVSSQAGATAKLSQSFQSGASKLLQYLCLSFPVHGHIRPIIGIGDLIVLSVIYFALHHLGFRGVFSFVAPVAGILIAVFVGLMLGGIFAIPFITVTTVIYMWFYKHRL